MVYVILYILFSQIVFLLNSAIYYFLKLSSIWLYFIFFKIIFKLNRFTGWSWNYSISWFWEFFPCFSCILMLQVIDCVGIVEWGSPRNIAFVRVVFQFKFYLKLFKFYMDIDCVSVFSYVVRPFVGFKVIKLFLSR